MIHFLNNDFRNHIIFCNANRLWQPGFPLLIICYIQMSMTFPVENVLHQQLLVRKENSKRNIQNNTNTLLVLDPYCFSEHAMKLPYNRLQGNKTIQKRGGHYILSTLMPTQFQRFKVSGFFFFPSTQWNPETNTFLQRRQRRMRCQSMTAEWPGRFKFSQIFSALYHRCSQRPHPLGLATRNFSMPRDIVENEQGSI